LTLSVNRRNKEKDDDPLYSPQFPEKMRVRSLHTGKSGKNRVVLGLFGDI